MIKNIKWLFLASLALVACSDNDETTIDPSSSDGQPLTAGSANFSKYVALGNSLTAGYSDGALFIDGQKGSWTNVLANQFKLVGGGDFKTPLMADNIGGFKILGTVRSGSRLYFNGTGPAPAPGTPSTEILTSISGAGPYNNCGIPGAKSFHLLSPGYGNPAGIPATANPYYVRFAPVTPTSVLSYAMAQTPTFFSLWIGNNDVLGYAIAGGVTTAQDPINGGDITPPTGAAGVGFDGTYDALVNTLTSAGAKGVVANIPYVNTVPLFTTVKYNAVPLNAAQVSALNSGYATYNAGVAASPLPAAEKAARTINFVIGQNAVVIVDEYLTNLTSFGLPSLRQATAMDYIVLSSGGVSAQAHLGAGNGTATPLADKWVLSKGEVAEIKTATDAYNVKIKAVATAKGLAFVDANAIMSQIANGGIVANGYNVTNVYVTGGGFSLDGVHPSPRGYALIANKFIEAINATYGSNLKGVSLYDYRILFPAVL